MKSKYLFFGAIVLLWGCKPPQLTELEFLEVQTDLPALIEVGSIRMTGRVSGLDRALPETNGFIWSENLQEVLEAGNNAQRIEVAPLQRIDSAFTHVFPLERNQTIYFRAFASLGERLVYSPPAEIRSFTMGQIVTMEGAATIDNDSARVQGRIIGLEVLKETLEQHGHVISATSAVPDLDNADLVTALGSINDDTTFTSAFGNLAFNTTYYVRAYVRTGAQEVLYSPDVDTFHVRDGWKKMNNFQLFQDGVAAAIESKGKAYLGFGCDNQGACPASSLSNLFWEFSPDANGQFSTVKAFPTSGNPSGFLRTNATMVTLGDTLYFIGGEREDGFGTAAVLDFWKYVPPPVDKWYKGAEPSISQIQQRTGATGFALNNKLYFGLGSNFPSNVETFQNTWWEYNPPNGHWRKVKSMPLRKDEINTGYLDRGRSEAVAFVIDGAAYVGGGVFGDLPLRDFWKFTPPTSAQDSGSWEFFGFFPGLGRKEAVHFTADNRGFYGTGYSITSGFLNDFWEFNPAASTPWVQRQPFEGGHRRRALGFSLAGKGYVGTGLKRIITNNGMNLDEDVESDIWMYTPLSQ